MKKNKAFLLCFCLGIASLYAQTVEIHPKNINDQLNVTLTVEQLDLNKISSSIELGFTARYHFELQVYEADEGFFKFFGGRLLESHSVSYEAKYNMLYNAYQVTSIEDDSEKSERILFPSFTQMSEFIKTARFSMVTNTQNQDDELVFRYRVRVYPIQQKLPFNLIHPLLINNLQSTFWQKIQLPIKDLE